MHSSMRKERVKTDKSSLLNYEITKKIFRINSLEKTHKWVFSLFSLQLFNTKETIITDFIQLR